MPFDWLVPTIPDAVRAGWPRRRRDVAEEDARIHAALLMRLGRDRATAEGRLLRNAAWEAEMTGRRALADKELKALVKGVYAR